MAGGDSVAEAYGRALRAAGRSPASAGAGSAVAAGAGTPDGAGYAVLTRPRV